MASIQLSFKPKLVSQKLLRALNDRTRDIIEKRYGLSGSKKSTLESIGKSYSITRERVRQIENTALNNIRKSKEYKNHENVFDELSTIVKKFGSIIHEEILMSYISNDTNIHNHINFLMTTSNKFKKNKENDDLHPSWSVNDDIAKHVHQTLLQMHKTISKSELIKEEEIITTFSKDLINLEEEYRNNKDVIKRFLELSKKLKMNPLKE
ncbi:MAG: sigma factor-like helix-turn-helix DNA-binding protein [Cyanobium sp. MAG06]|nr:sigma factor-like helix-turn-helix DNA-binding protein [Cyanobium sp. MAG06]